MKYVAPEIVDFRWMEGMGVCFSGSAADEFNCGYNGMSAGTKCNDVGSNAGSICSNGSSPNSSCNDGWGVTGGNP
jgi:hypothetical protein